MSDLGKRYGCSVAAMVAVLPILPLAFVMGWVGAHCSPVPSCQRRAELGFRTHLIEILIFASFIGFGVRQFINGMAARREDEGHSMTFSLTASLLSLTSIAVALALLLTIASL